MDPISPKIKQTILEARENGLKPNDILFQYGFDLKTIKLVFQQTQPKHVEEDMFHQGLRYTFKWSKQRHHELKDPQSRTGN